jgi:hypothetical protein
MAITIRSSNEWIVPFTVSIEEIRDSILVKETWSGEEDAEKENTEENEATQRAMAMQRVPLAGLE